MLLIDRSRKASLQKNKLLEDEFNEFSWQGYQNLYLQLKQSSSKTDR